MSKQLLRAGFGVVIGLLFTTRLWPLLTNSFYFTMDQGRDAVYVRDLLHDHFPTRGPETTIAGVYHGVGWYYLLALGGSHPAGGLVVLIVLTTAATASVVWKYKRPDIGALLIFFWPHYNLTRYAFNPFLLFPLSLLLFLLLSNHFVWAAIPAGLAVHAHLTAGLPLIFIYIIYGLIKRPKHWLLGCGILTVLLWPLWSQLPILLRTTAKFEWRDWYVAYIWPLLLIGLLLKIKSKLTWLLLPIFAYHFYLQYPGHRANDPSILANQLKEIDHIYDQAQGQGFKVYTYVPSVYDYQYQYLIWWRGLKKYGYLPCEYSTYPEAPDTFVPHKSLYTQPQKPCSNLQFTIVEPDPIHPELRDAWIRNLNSHSPKQ